MTISTLDTNPQRAARLAGLLYVMIAAIGPFAILYVPSIVFNFGDAAANAASMLENEGLLRLGILADMGIVGLEILITSVLFTLFKPVSGTGAMVAVLARFGMIVVMTLNLINYLVPLHLVGGADYLQSFSTDQLQSMALLFLEAHEIGVYAWQIFFAVHLLALGYLVIKSGYFPRIIGIMIMVGSFGYSLQSIEKFVVPGHELLGYAVVGLLTVVSVGEVSLGLWMLIRGANPKALEERGQFVAA